MIAEKNMIAIIKTTLWLLLTGTWQTIPGKWDRFFSFFLDKIKNMYLPMVRKRSLSQWASHLDYSVHSICCVAAWCSEAVSCWTRRKLQYTLCYPATSHISAWQSTIKHTTTTANVTSYSCFVHIQTLALSRKCFYLQAETGKEKEPLQTYKE